jgi:hypothetical protein
MASTLYSWLISVPPENVPESLLRLDSPEFGDFLQQYDYLENTSPRYGFPEAFVAELSKKLSLPSLAYVQQPFQVLRAEEVSEAAKAFDFILLCCETAPEKLESEEWEITPDQIREAASLSEEEFWDEVENDDENDPEGPSVWRFLAYVRRNMDWLRTIEGSGQCAVYVSVI